MRVLVVVVVGALLAACASAPVEEAEPETVLPSTSTFPTTSVTVHGEDTASLAVHVAADPDARAQGLMHREELPDRAGMVFVYPEDTTGGFWMKNTLIPLSIAFLDEEGRILSVLDMEPCERDPCPTYDPGLAYRHALEVNEGVFDELGAAEGDLVELPDDLPAAR
jgi:uncharacterized protein